MQSSLKPFVHAIDQDGEYLESLKIFFNSEPELMGHTLLYDKSTLTAILTIQQITGPTVFLLDYSMDWVSIFRFLDHLKETFRYPWRAIVLIPKDDHALASEVLRNDAEPFSKEPPERGKPFNLGELFKERILREERTLNAQTFDELTGAYRRNQLLEMWKKDFVAAKKGRKSTVFVYLDINYFGAINKVVGEPVGDTYIAAFGRCLLEAAGTDDIVCRQGGDEFLIVLNDAGHFRARKFLQTLRKLVSAVIVKLPDAEMPLTFSAGYNVIHARHLGGSPHDVLRNCSKAANEKMKQDKLRMHREIMCGAYGSVVKALLIALDQQKEGV